MAIEKDDPILTAYVLGELDDARREAIQQQIKASPDLQKEVEAIRRTAELLGRELAAEPAPDIPVRSAGSRGRRGRRAGGDKKFAGITKRRWPPALKVAAVLVVVAGASLIAGILLPHGSRGIAVAPDASESAGTGVRRHGEGGHEGSVRWLGGAGDIDKGLYFGAGELSAGVPTKEVPPPPHAIPPATAASKLKLIYDAQMQVTLDKAKADGFAAALAERVRSLGGYVSQSASAREAGLQPSGRISLRVPADRLKELMDWVAAVATVRLSQMSVRDITEQYVDVEARLANLLAGEARLKDMLAKETGKLEEILKVENQIRSVREQIERLQGKQRLWDSQIALSTLTVEYRVADIYIVAEPPAQTFTQRAGRAVKDSWRAFTGALADLGIGSIYVLPWVAVGLVLVLAGYLGLRRAAKGRSGGK